jgi:hypothetical protein
MNKGRGIKGGKELTMAKNEKSGSKVATIASRVLKNPSSATQRDAKSLAASVLTQRPDKKRK